MNKRQAKIEALEIAYGLLISCDGGMWDAEDNSMSEIDRGKILVALEDLGFQLHMRAVKLRKKCDGKKAQP